MSIFILTLTEGWDNYYRLNMKNGSLYQENQELNRANKELTEENARLRSENKDYSLLRKVFGRKQIDDLVEHFLMLIHVKQICVCVFYIFGKW